MAISHKVLKTYTTYYCGSLGTFSVFPKAWVTPHAPKSQLEKAFRRAERYAKTIHGVLTNEEAVAAIMEIFAPKSGSRARNLIRPNDKYAVFFEYNPRKYEGTVGTYYPHHLHPYRHQVLRLKAHPIGITADLIQVPKVKPDALYKPNLKSELMATLFTMMAYSARPRLKADDPALLTLEVEILVRLGT